MPCRFCNTKQTGRSSLPKASKTWSLVFYLPKQKWVFSLNCTHLHGAEGVETDMGGRKKRKKKRGGQELLGSQKLLPATGWTTLPHTWKLLSK